MRQSEFNIAELQWADALLQQPAYTMPNGKSSHDVAHEVKAAALDRMLNQNRVNARGDWR